MKKRIYSISATRTNLTLSDNDFFVVDDGTSTFKVSKLELFTAILKSAKAQAPLRVFDANNNQFVSDEHKFKIDDGGAGVFNVSQDPATNTIILDVGNIIYNLNFKDEGSGEIFEANVVDTLSFLNFGLELDEVTSTLIISPLNQRPEVQVVDRENLSSQIILDSLSARIIQISNLSSDLSIKISRDWVGKIVVVDDSSYSTVSLVDNTNNLVFVEFGPLTTNKIRAAEIWWNSLESQFVVLTLSIYE